MGCGCNKRRAWSPPAGVDGVWSVVYPHGSVRAFPSEEEAKAFAASRGPGYVVQPPA